MILKYLSRYFPLPVFAGLFLLACLLSFNGLYGQDAHEYLRLTRVFFDYFREGVPLAAAIGRSEMAGGYPLAGALLQFVIPDSILALQVLSWAALAGAVWVFGRILRLWAHGAGYQSKTSYMCLMLALSPFILRAGLTVMADALGLFFFLAALWQGLKVLEKGDNKSAVWAAVFAGLAVITRWTATAFLLPYAVAIGWHLMRERRFGWMIAAFTAGVIAVLPHFYFGIMGFSGKNVFAHQTLRDWSAINLFKATFVTTNGTLKYLLPNVLYVFSPLAHFGFCLPLSLLFLMARKTDFHHPSQRVLLFCLACLLLFVGGLPCQNMRYLIPGYVVLLLFLFPAWDRFFSYGFYFYKKLTWAIIGIILAAQLSGGALVIAHPLGRNHLEATIAAKLHRVLPPGAVLYSFDIDVAMRSYLPGCRIINLWEQRYEDYPPGSFVLFNEAGLRAQWEGQNPMLNWETIKEKYILQEVAAFPQGWVLYRIN